MDIDSEKNYKLLLKAIKKRTKLSPKKGLKFNLTEFTILEIGNLFVNSYAWGISGFLNESYFLSLINSHQEEVQGILSGSSPGVIYNKEYRQIGILFKLDFELPNLIIRPFYFKEKMANIFLKFDVKLKGRETFNSKYVLESKAEMSILQNLLSKKLTSLLVTYDDFSLEIIDSNILLKFERNLNKKNTFALFDIASVLDKELKNYSVL